MKLINKALHLITLILLMSTSSCQDKYPELEDGLYAEIVTSKGTIIAKLEYEKIPLTVSNFVALAEGNHPLVKDEYKAKKYYNGLIFHRVMDQFMIQTGDPTGTGSGDPGYKFSNEIHPDFKYDKPGVLGMANSGPGGTNGSQFFITEVPYPSLDNNYTIFGELVKGFDVQDSISNVKVGPGNKPVEDVVMTEVNIIRKGLSAKSFNAPNVFNEELPKVVEKQQALKDQARKKAEEQAALARDKFLKDNESLKGRIENFQTGISMIYTQESNGIKPNSTDFVMINCAGYFTNGDLFYTTWEDIAQKYGKYDSRNTYEPFPMIYNETANLVAGFREAMLNMNVGDKVRVYIPFYLGYGERGYGSIPPNTDLIFDIEITGIQGK